MSFPDNYGNTRLFIYLLTFIELRLLCGLSRKLGVPKVQAEGLSKQRKVFWDNKMLIWKKKSELLLETNCEDNKPVSSFLFCKCRKGGNLNEMSHSCEDHDWAQGELLRFLWRKDPLPWQLLSTAKRMSGGEHEQLFGRKRATLILSSYSANAAPRLSN